MRTRQLPCTVSVILGLAVLIATPGWTQDADRPRPGDSGGPPVDGGPPDGGPDFDGPPPFGPGGFDGGGFGPGGGFPGGPGGRQGPGGPGGMMGQDTKLVAQYDKDGDGRLNAAERKAAREQLAQRSSGRRGPRGPGGGGFPGRGGQQGAAQPGPKLSPADVKSFPDAPLYDALTLRTFFLEFENQDWEKELADFKNTDVEVPAKLTVDGRVYPDVGVHFRGMSSFMMVSEGQKRSLNLSMDFVHKGQELGGYRTLNLLNSHEDPTFLHSVLYMHIARQYIPSPQVNFVRVVINGECWGIYVNAQQFNKDFLRDWFGTTEGARWKVPGSPGGRGSLAYLGDNIDSYRGIYAIKSKDDSRVWTELIRLCKVLSETSKENLEQELAPLLDIDGALKFLALENVLVNGDGYYLRSSDYNLYLDVKGRFHIIPHDGNETFTLSGGPGGPGGAGGPPGFGGGRGGSGPGALVAPQVLSQADKNQDQKLSREEFVTLADTWFDKLDTAKAGKLNQEAFVAALNSVLTPPQGAATPGGNPGGSEGRGGDRRGGFGPAAFIGPGLFQAVDADKDGSLTRTELEETFAKWFGEWDKAKTDSLDEEGLRNGWLAALPRPEFGGRRGGFGGRGGPGGPGGFGGGGGPGGGRGGGGGVKLDPLVSANDTSRPLLSKLLAVPALRARYLSCVRDLAENWLDWNRLGPLATQYQALIADAVKADTRKLESTEDFLTGITGGTEAQSGTGPGRSMSLKSFVEQRRAFLLSWSETKGNVAKQ